MFLIQFAIMISAHLITRALAPKQDKPKPAALTDWDVPTIDEGTPQAIIFGDCWDDSFHVLGIGNYRTYPVKSSGGKK